MSVAHKARSDEGHSMSDERELLSGPRRALCLVGLGIAFATPWTIVKLL
jgi:hypothetical protein